MFSFSEPSLAWAAARARRACGGSRPRRSRSGVHGSWTRPLADRWGHRAPLERLDRRDGGEPAPGARHRAGARRVGRGVWLSAGWNRFGYDDPDLPDEAYTREGVYLRIRSKFDESLVSRSSGRP